MVDKRKKKKKLEVKRGEFFDKNYLKIHDNKFLTDIFYFF